MSYQRGDVVWGPDPFKSGDGDTTVELTGRAESGQRIAGLEGITIVGQLLIIAFAIYCQKSLSSQCVSRISVLGRFRCPLVNQVPTGD